MTKPTGGLGRGLGAILSAPSTPKPSTDGLRSRVVDHGLSILAEIAPLRLCGYLHEPFGAAELTMRTPPLTSMHPTESYALFSMLKKAAGSVGRHEYDDASVVVTATDAGIGGIFIFDPVDATAISALSSFCESYDAAIREHLLAPGDDERARHVPAADASATNSALAEATLRWGTNPAMAGWKIDDVSEITFGPHVVIIVTISSESGELVSGAAPQGRDSNDAAVWATVRATTRIAG